MKMRSGFVSNSSSSSFVVISSPVDQTFIAKIRKAYGDRGEFIVDASNGEYEFGWQNEKYNDFWSKVNFAYLQARYVEKDPKYSYTVKVHPEWLVMLEKVLKDNLNVKTIVWNMALEWHHGEENQPYGYIDHQSASYEGANIEIFESEDALTRFLFSDGSYIQCGNDNE